MVILILFTHKNNLRASDFFPAKKKSMKLSGTMTANINIDMRSLFM